MSETVKTFDILEHNLEFQFNYNKDETEALHELLNNDDSVTLEKLRRASMWKLNRVLQISETTINKLKSWLLRKI
jgi:predicted transcriptional regulator